MCCPRLFALSCVVLSVSCAPSRAAQAADAPAGDAAKSAASPEQIAALEKSLSGATLVGHFTVTGDQAAPPDKERYELGQVKHQGGDVWLIEARIRYGANDVKLPLTLPIRWAGDTPVITVDNLGVPGLGVYTARVMIYRDHYAGFWTGADHGGHLYGMIERGDKAAGGGRGVVESEK